MNDPNAQTKRRCTLEARKAIAEACHAMDIRLEDIEPEKAAWEGVQTQLAGLMARAFVRNHNQ